MSKRPPVPQLSSITIGGETLDLDSLLTGEFEDVSQAAEELPAAIAWLNWKRADAVQWEMITERELKEAEATAYFELRNGAYEERGYGGRPTDKALSLAVRLEDTVKKAAQRHETKRAHRERIHGQIEALQAKLDLIRTSEATRRRLTNAPPTDQELEDMVQEETDNT